ncbi:MAG: type II toxin-antitoxin system RelE/ParE family toxin [Candidatus Obscuribacter sp.]|nr:type II toxin-antitoxin system RelE/ParE family toxin [Candidatus Obscuribacter sp.]
MCVAKFEDAVYVLHTFKKKTQKTADKDLNIARTAYAELKRNETKNSYRNGIFRRHRQHLQRFRFPGSRSCESSGTCQIDDDD